jgi:hypothetical protein
MNSYYVYLHKTKDGVPFYVGKGKGRRAYSTNRNDSWKELVSSIGEYDVEIRYKGLSEEDSFAIEKRLIAEIGLGNLTNMTNGGEGGSRKDELVQQAIYKLDCIIALSNITEVELKRDKNLRDMLKDLNFFCDLHDEIKSYL